MDRTTFVWAAAALIVLAAEMFAGTVYLLAWAAGAAAGAIVQWASGSWALAAGVAAVVMALGSMQAHRVRAGRAAPMADIDVGGEVRLLRPLGDGRWRVSFRGAEWDARLAGDAATTPTEGAFARIRGREANVLLIEVL